MTSPDNSRILRDDIKADPSGEASQTAPVLFVDLDGTLIRTDLLHEGVLVLLKEAPWRLIQAIFKLSAGRAAFKQAVAEAATLDVKQLPYREDVLKFITENRALGREIVLATAASDDLARRVANHLALFDGILASDGTTNLKGSVKLEAIQRHCRERGDVEFDYIGDSRADVPIWRAARGVFAVAPSPRLESEISALAKPTTIIGTRDSIVRLLFSTLRPRQWVKNTLVFVPLVTAHKVSYAPLTFAAVLAFACFCLCASAVYVLNDLFDLNADRQHPIKRGRPLASGGLPVIWGPPLSMALLISAFAIAAFTLPIGFGVALAVYFGTACAYSLYSKHIAMLDVLMRAGLYTIRILAGGAATGISVSQWMLGFSMFLFVSLAFAKRYAELERPSRDNE